MNNLKKLLFILILTVATTWAEAQIKFGYDAPDIALPSANGDTLRLSSLKGKVVLLDFWASWCRPCRTANKGLGKLYSKFKKKGFEIFSVSLDDEKADWIKAIRQDKINWLQVNDSGGWNAATVTAWGLFALPTSYLIDKTGKLIAMDLEGKDLEKALEDILGD